jgi:hypothetical protein
VGAVGPQEVMQGVREVGEVVEVGEVTVSTGVDQEELGGL